jgi:predicted MFS family arabinose efflux permease
LLSISVLAFPMGLVAARNLRGALKAPGLAERPLPAEKPVSVELEMQAGHEASAAPARLETRAAGVLPPHAPPLPALAAAAADDPPPAPAGWPARLAARRNPSIAWATLLAFILMTCFQAWASQNMTTFIPKYLSDLGKSASVYGFIAALYTGGTAIGNLIGGALADRYGGRRVTAITLALAALPLFFLPSVGFSWALYLLAPLAGLLIGATNSVIVVQGQSLVPGGMALASGLVLGLSFSGGALGTFVTGRLADLWGLPPVFPQTALLALAAGLLALVVSWRPVSHRI